MYIILVFSSLSFLYSIKIGVKKTQWITHGVSISMALLLYSLPISYTALFNGELTIGLDWLILDFLVTAIIFTPLELFSPNNPNQTKFHKDWKTDLTYFIVFDLSVKFIIIAIRFPAEYFFTNTSFNQLHKTIQAIPYFPQLIMALFTADFFNISDIRPHTEFHFIQEKLNHRPRKKLGYRTPYEVFYGLFVLNS